jgi:hypothetical protein
LRDSVGITPTSLFSLVNKGTRSLLNNQTTILRSGKVARYLSSRQTHQPCANFRLPFARSLREFFAIKAFAFFAKDDYAFASYALPEYL